MLTSQDIKEFAKKHGADIVGVGSMDRFEGAPPELDPRYIFPEANAIVGLAFRINRGCFRGIEEGTYFAAYPAMGYAGINFRDAPITLRAVCNMIEDEGYEAVPLQNYVLGTSYELNTGEKSNYKYPSKSVAPGRPAPDVFVHFRIAAFICGMGEIGYSKIFLTPEFGPRQRFVFLLTDAPLEPDPIYDGPPICDRCMECVKNCTVGAISRTKTVKVTVAGHELEWGELNEVRCSCGYTGANPKYNPFASEDHDMDECFKTLYNGGGFPYDRSAEENFQHPSAVEGGRGCMRGCFVHLEETGRITKTFKNPFRKREQWKL